MGFVEEIAQSSFNIVTELGEFVVELLPSSRENLYLKDVDTYYENNKLVIKGRVKRGSLMCCERVTGHVDVAAFTSDGYVIDAASTRLSPRYIPKKGTKSSRFKTYLTGRLPSDASVRIAFHHTKDLQRSGGGKNRLECSENLALFHDRTGNLEITKHRQIK